METNLPLVGRTGGRGEGGTAASVHCVVSCQASGHDLPFPRAKKWLNEGEREELEGRRKGVCGTNTTNRVSLLPSSLPPFHAEWVCGNMHSRVVCVCDGCLFLLPAIPPPPIPPSSPFFWRSLDPATARPSRERGRIWKKDSLYPPLLLLGSVGSFQDRETETEIRSHMHPGKKHVAKGVGRDDLPCLTWGNIGEGSGILDTLTDCRLLVKNHHDTRYFIPGQPLPLPFYHHTSTIVPQRNCMKEGEGDVFGVEVSHSIMRENRVGFDG